MSILMKGQFKEIYQRFILLSDGGNSKEFHRINPLKDTFIEVRDKPLPYQCLL